MSVIFFLLSGICHQYASRCFVYEWQPLPLCARCMGTYLGLSMALLSLQAMGRGRRSGWPIWPIWVIAVGLIGMWVVDSANSTMDWVVGRTLYRMSSIEARLFIGLGNGLGWAIIVYPLLHSVIWGERDTRPALDRLWQVLPPAAILGGIGWLVLKWRRAPYLFWVAADISATLGALSLVNMMLVLLIARQDGKARAWGQTILYLLGGLALTLIELSAVALLRRWLGS